MTAGLVVWPLLGLVSVLVLLRLAVWARGVYREVQAERARESFRLQAERLAELFRRAAAATGKPRGLIWSAVTVEPGWEVVRDRMAGGLAALVPVTIAFEAVPESDMDGLPAVGNLRPATALFAFERGDWTTAGRAVFNLSPAEVRQQSGGRYEILPHG